jgi:phage terminase small subunit
MGVLGNPRHEIFAQEIAKGASNGDAYAKAGYESGNPDSVRAASARLLATVSIRSRVKEIQEVAAKRTGITIERTLLELAKVGYADIRKAVKWGDGVAVERNGETVFANGVCLVNSEEIDDDTAQAICEVKQTKEGVSIKFHDKLGALEKIGKHLGMFVDNSKIDVNVKHSWADFVEEVAAKRLAEAKVIEGEVVDNISPDSTKDG